ncbi:MAG TPA: hypothetical protein VNC40_05790 [Gaiellaceae bacterium]|nr:hypothetical protein [Gaiellaceae bacterium]
MRLLLRLAVLTWVARWAVLELASRLGHRLPAGPAPLDSARPPGWMPGPE